MATQRLRGRSLELKAYAGTDPATGKPQYLYERVPADIGVRELNRVKRDLDARANERAESRRARRKDPHAAPKPKRLAKARTIGEAVEVWWAKHGSKLASGPKVRTLIDGIILPNLGDVPVVLAAGTPPDEDDERDHDLVYLSERWEAIARGDRKVRPDEDGNQPEGKPGPLEPATIHRCHGIVGAALRRAGHPISDPGLPSILEGADTTPLPEEMAAFLEVLASPPATPAYTVTRRVRGTDAVVRYEVPAKVEERSAMDLMTEAFAMLVMTGPRPVEAAAVTRMQFEAERRRLSLDGRGVVAKVDEDGKESWVLATGETVKRRRRVITLDPRTAGAIGRWLTFQDEYALALGRRLGPRSLVFSLAADASEVLSPKVLSKSFARAVTRARKAGLDLPEGFHLYDCRHFGISQLLRDGRDVGAVAKRFGTSARMIDARYRHCIDADDAHLADSLEALWLERSAGEVIDLPLGDERSGG